MGVDVLFMEATKIHSDKITEAEPKNEEEVEEEEDCIEEPRRDTGFDINLYKQMLIKILDERHLYSYKFNLEDLEKVADEQLQVSALPNGIFEITRTKYE